MRGFRSVMIVLALVVACAALYAIGWPASDYRHNDFFQFWAAPHALVEGASPYDIAWWREFYARAGSVGLERSPAAATASPYPLWTHVILVPLALLPFELAAPLWLVLQLSAIALGLAVLRSTILRAAPARDGVLLAGLAIAFQPVWLTAGGGNISGFLFGISAAALGAALAGRAAAAGAIAALVLLKPQGALLSFPALLAGVPRGRASFAAGALASAIALLGASLALRPGWPADWLRNASALQSSAGSNATGWTLDRALPQASPLLPLLAELLAVGALVAWILARRPPLALLYGAAVPISLFVAPHGWSYDQLLLLITAAVALDRLSGLDDARRRAGTGALFAILGVAPWLLYALASQRGGEEWSALTPLVTFALLLWIDAAAGAREPAVRPSAA